MRVVETYDTPDGFARRFWAREGRLLVGGRILGPGDGQHLRDAYRVTHVLSVELEHDDETSGFGAPRRARFAFPDADDAPEIPEQTVWSCVGFARSVLSRPGTVLYLHCMMGGARSPCIAYALLVADEEDPVAVRAELEAIGSNLRPQFIRSINRALRVGENT